MAEKRMFSKAIIDSDMFLDMPLTAQALYFHMSMRADDDGFVDNPKKIQRMVGASDDDFKLLIAKQFILAFESGIIVIKHWKIHNYIRCDRYKPTIHQAEKSHISTDENKMYSLGMSSGIPNDNQRLTQNRLDKINIDKTNIDIEESMRGEKSKSVPKKPKHKYGEYKNVLLSDEDLDKLKNEFPNDWEERIERLSDYVASTGKVYKNHLATIRTWAKKDKDNPQQSSGYGKKESTRTWCTGNEPSAEEILGLV